MEQEKKFKDAKWFAVGLLVLVVIIFISNIVKYNTYMNSLSNRLYGITTGNFQEFTSIIIPFIIHIAVLIITIVGCHNKKIYGPICGIIFSVLLIISKDIISLVFGILYMIDCIALINFLNQNKNQNNSHN